MNFKVENVSSVRRGINEYIAQAERNNPIRALFEVDVTDLRNAIRKYRRETGNNLSLTSYLGSVFAQALADNPGVQKYHYGKKKVVSFENVDLCIVIERKVEGKLSPSNYIVRNADTKGMEEIEREIREAKKADDDNAIGEKKNPGQKFARLPSIIRRILLALVFTRKPHLRRKIFGTAVLSSVGMFGHANGYGIPYTPYTMSLMVGGLGKKPRFVGHELKNREMLHLTLTINHDMVDGAPMSRFVHELIALIHNAHGLEKYREK